MDAIARAKYLAEQPMMKDVLYLVHKGIPYQQAMALDASERLACIVIFGELDGGSWNWDRMEWRE